MIPNSNDMRFEVTTKCNFNCIICPREKLTRKKETMSLYLFRELFDKIVAQTDQYDTLSFPGMGEPLLDEGLEDKIEYAKRRKPGIAVLLLTNGSLLTAERFKILEKTGLTSVRVSFYGIDEDSYSRVHGIKNKNMFEAVKNNVLNICKIKKKTALYLTYNIVKNVNAHKTGDWVSFWKDKVDLIEVWRPHNWVDGRSYRVIQVKKLDSCGRPYHGPLQVQVDGTVNMCCFDFDGKLTIGDLKTESLREIFSGKKFNQLKKCHDTGNFNGCNFICQNCDQRNEEKDDVMVYNSKFDIKERVKMISTTYEKVIE